MTGIEAIVGIGSNLDETERLGASLDQFAAPAGVS
jgi:hypothetical protein